MQRISSDLNDNTEKSLNFEQKIFAFFLQLGGILEAKLLSLRYHCRLSNILASVLHTATIRSYEHPNLDGGHSFRPQPATSPRFVRLLLRAPSWITAVRILQQASSVHVLSPRRPPRGVSIIPRHHPQYHHPTTPHVNAPTYLNIMHYKCQHKHSVTSQSTIYVNY
jgi:hypothetical protein